MEVLVELLSQKIVRFVIKHETWQDDTLACGSFSDIGPAAKRLFKKIRGCGHFHMTSVNMKTRLEKQLFVFRQKF